jgi:hypothetical protein
MEFHRAVLCEAEFLQWLAAALESKREHLREESPAPAGSANGLRVSCDTLRRENMNWTQKSGAIVGIVQRGVLVVFCFALAVFTIFALAPLCATPSCAQSAQSNAKSGASAPASVAPRATSAPANRAAARKGGNHEGITVHGHWVIEVKNPDGAIVQRREFENSLTQHGPAILTVILSGNQVPGGWYISLQDPANPRTGSPCQGLDNSITGAQGACFILQQGLSYADIISNAVPTSFCTNSPTPCSYTLGSALGSGGSFVLSGSIQANQVGNIGSVATNLVACYPFNSNPASSLPLLAASPSQCGSATVDPTTTSIGVATLTSTNLQNPVNNVQPNQTVTVTVIISFSSGS